MAKKKEGIQLPENITRDMMDEAARDFISLNEQLKKNEEYMDMAYIFHTQDTKKYFLNLVKI